MSSGNFLGNLTSMIPGAQQDGLAAAITHAFQSDQTPPFGQMVSGLFEQSSNEQKAGILNQLIASIGPQVMQSGAFGNLAEVLNGASHVTPEQASQIDPAAVHQMAEHAQQHDPSIVEAAGNFYSQHPTLVQGLGAAALAMIASHFSKR